MNVGRLRTIRELFEAMDKAAERGESLCVYTPLHKIMWDHVHIDYRSQHYFNSLDVHLNDPEINDVLFSSSPFKIVKLYLSYLIKNKKEITVKIEKDPNDDFNLGFLFFQSLIASSTLIQSQSKNLTDRIKKIVQYLTPDFEFDENTLYFKASHAVVRSYYDRTLCSNNINCLLMSDLPIYLNRGLAVKNTIYNGARLFINTKKVVNTQVDRFILPVSAKKVTLFNGLISIKDPLDRLLFRKIIMRNAKVLNDIYDELTEKYNEIIKNDSFESFDPENFINYKEWNKRINEIIQFTHGVSKKDRLKYFLGKNLA